VTVTVYRRNVGTLISNVKSAVAYYESLFSVTDRGSDVYRANNSGGESVEVALETEALVFSALRMCALTDGALDISVYPVVRAWGFTTERYRIPPEEELAELLRHVDHSRIGVDPGTARITVPDGMMIDLGSVAKGYIGDMLRNTLVSSGAASAIISLGGDVMTYGVKPDRTPWLIAVRNPAVAADRFLGVISVTGSGAVMTSGGYERNFTGPDGTVYHHIIDPATGYPADSGLISVTVASSGDFAGFYGDALSTAMLVLGKDAALRIWRQLEGAIFGVSFDLILVTDSGEVVITPGLRDRFELTADGYTLTVLGG
jgi:thiamine biosynthesis lipoprotein